MGKLARLRQLKEMLARENPDIIGLQETIKRSFRDSELEALAPGKGFSWGWIAAHGHSGGILLGVKQDILQVEDWETGDFFVGVTVRHRVLNVRWKCVIVYGPAQHERSNEFLTEISQVGENTLLPLLIGGDFNLIRGYRVKNKGGGDAGRISMFNDFIERLELREIYRGRWLHLVQ